jgi:hypothetical protein
MTGKSSASAISVCAALIGALTLGVCQAHAGPGSLADKLFRKPLGPGRLFDAPPVAHYMSDDGDGFTLDRSGDKPLLKFDDNAEVWALTTAPGPRGDVIYKNDLGRAVLRATRLGGVTLFSSDEPNGEAVSLLGGAAPIKLQLMSFQALSDRLLQASFRSHRVMGHGVAVQAEATPASTAVMGDAVMVATKAFYRVSERPGGRSLLSRIVKVQLVEGKKPSASIKDDTLWITVAPAQGFAGRPSSDRIVRLFVKGR